MVISPNDKRGIYYTHIPDDKIPPGSQPYYVEITGKWMHIMIETAPGVFEKYEPKDIIEQYPEKLKRAVQMPCNRSYWAMSKNPLEKLAIGAVVAVIGIGAILMFAMTTDKPDPKPAYQQQQGVVYDIGN